MRWTAAHWTARFTNRYAFTDLSELQCRWQALTTTGSDHVLAGGEIKLACPPGASTSLLFPIAPEADALRVSFVNAGGTEVYAVRLRVAGAPVPQPPPALATNTLAADDTPGSVGVSADGFSLRIDRASGKVLVSRGPTSVVAGAHPQPGRTAIRRRRARNRNDGPYVGSKYPPIITNVRVNGGLSSSSGTWQGGVTADVRFAEVPDLVIGQLTYDLTLHRSGQIDWSYHLKWLAIDMQAWEFGLKLDLPGEADHYSWYRQGQWTEYPLGHIGDNRGSVTHADQSFQCTKRDTIWASVTSDLGSGLVITATDGPLHTRCRPKGGLTTLFASSVVSVDRSFSSGYCESTRVTFKQGHTYSGMFRTWLTGDAP